jgi:hypothetical protein
MSKTPILVAVAVIVLFGFVVAQHEELSERFAGSPSLDCVREWWTSEELPDPLSRFGIVRASRILSYPLMDLRVAIRMC